MHRCQGEDLVDEIRRAVAMAHGEGDELLELALSAESNVGHGRLRVVKDDEVRGVKGVAALLTGLGVCILLFLPQRGGG